MADPIDTPNGPLTIGHFQSRGVRHRAFVVPKFRYALFNPRDRMQVVLRTFMEFIRDGDLPYRRLLLDGHIVDESATRLKKVAALQHAGKFLQAVDESDLYRLEFVSEDAFHGAKKRFIAGTELDASFTDFVIAAHMSEMGVDHFVTDDSHFEAFGDTRHPYRE